MILNNNLRQQLNIKLLLFKESTFILIIILKLLLYLQIFLFVQFNF